MPHPSVPKRWPTGMIEVATNIYGYVQPLLVERLYMELQGEM